MLMSKYEKLDPRSQLEQTITEDLKKALEKRGFEIKHNGKKDSQALGGVPDIKIWDSNYHINVEVTKTTKSSSDREFLSIKDHLDKIKGEYTLKNC